MRQRVTFIHDPRSLEFDPKKQLRVDKKLLNISGLQASREDQATFNVDELPQEIWRALKQCQMLRIRWETPQPYQAVAPFYAPVSPGLHVFYTPHGSIEDATLLCPLLQKVFGEAVKCTSSASSFTAMPQLSGRFAPSAAYTYYTRLDSVDDLGIYFLHKVCPKSSDACLELVSALKKAASVDIDYNPDARTLVLTTYRDRVEGQVDTKMSFPGRKESRLEVGVLSRETPTPQEPENLALGGLLTVVGRDTKPDSVLFTFPSRHHDAPGVSSGSSRFAMSFLSPTGLHPTMRLSISPTSTPSTSHCTLHAHLTLPSFLFPDKYQLSAPLFLASHNLKHVRGVWGETDLEAPDWAVSRWGSHLLLELAPPAPVATAPWHADVPLHLRYRAPNEAGVDPVQVPWPVLFWACRGSPATNLSENPFDRLQRGYEGLFAPSTLFYHLRPNATTPLLEQIEVPVLNTAKSAAALEPVTAAVIVGGVAWVLWRLLGGESMGKKEEEKRKRKQVSGVKSGGGEKKVQ